MKGFRTLLVLLVAPALYAQISGQVRLAGGAPAPNGVLVRVEGRSGNGIQTSTDAEGKFSFSGLGPGFFTVRARLAGYQDVSQEVTLTRAASAFLQFELKPVSDAQAALPPEGSTAAVSAVPEDARKAFDRGYALLMGKQDPKASIPFFEKAIRAYPSYADAYFRLGTAYLDLQRWADAQRVLERAVEIRERFAGAQLGLGSSLLAQGKLAEAEKRLRRGLELNDSTAQGHYELARVYWALDRMADAETHVRRALELDARFAPAHVLLGDILLRRGEQASALQAFREYLRLDPTGPLAAATQEVVKKLEKSTERKELPL